MGKEGVMPKEIVIDRQAPGETDPLLEVSWQRDLEHVQIAAYSRHSVTLQTIGREEAQFVTLDRPRINDLIRHLRRARDQAFGRDE